MLAKKSISFFYLAVVLVGVTVVAFAQPAEKQPAKKEEKISLDLKGVDILELLKMFSVKSGLNIAASKNVSGRITVYLNNLSFQDALDVILINQNLAYERKGDIITIMTAAEYEAFFGRKFVEKRKYKSLKLKYAKPANVSNIIGQIKSEVGKIIVDEASGTLLLIDIPEKLTLMEDVVSQMDQPLETEIFEFNYSKVKEIKAYLENLLTPGLGSIIIDERTNKAVISDLPERMNKIRSVVKAFDEGSRQVFIQGEIVQVSLDDKFTQGIEWDRILRERKWHGLDFVGDFPAGTRDSTGNLVAPYQKINVGTLATDDYYAILNFLQEYGTTRIISRPQILAVNNQEAKVMVGVREAYVTRTATQVEGSVQYTDKADFVDVGVKLNVVPTIGSDGFITMKIKPEVSNVLDTIETKAGSQYPIIETSQSETVVKVKDGATVMIAGLMKEEKRNSVAGIPVLSRLPLLGGLFGSRVMQPKRTELIVFLTPHLITGDLPISNFETEETMIKEQPKSEAKAEPIEKTQPKAKKAEKETAVALDISNKLKGIKH